MRFWNLPAIALIASSGLAYSADQTEEFGFGYFGYSHHSTTVEPGKTGMADEYSGSSSLYPTASAVNFSKGVYYKLDYEGTFAGLASFLNIGDVSGEEADSGSSGSSVYTGHFSGVLLPRTEIGLCIPTDFGFLGFGLNMDLASMGISGTPDFSGKMTSPGTSFDLGLQVQYVYTVWNGFHINPSFTYNLMFTDRQESPVDGSGMNFETSVTFKLLSFLSLYGTVGYDMRSFKVPDGASDAEGKLSDVAMRFAIAFHDIPSPFSSSVWGHN